MKATREVLNSGSHEMQIKYPATLQNYKQIPTADSSMFYWYKVLTGRELTIGHLTSITTGTDGSTSLPPIHDDVTDRILCFCDMSGADKNLPSEINTDGISDSIGVSFAKIY